MNPMPKIDLNAPAKRNPRRKPHNWKWNEPHCTFAKCRNCGEELSEITEDELCTPLPGVNEDDPRKER